MRIRSSIATASGLAAALAAVAPAHAAGGALTPDQVKAAFAKSPGSDGCTYSFSSVQIAAPRKASIGEMRAAGLPPKGTITPVRVAYVKACHPGFTRDYRWNYYFFKDDFGGWTMQSNAMPGNYESEPR